jgi:hypothetical protein
MPDRIEREIEDILNKLDDFVPEKGAKPIPFRKPAKRRSQNQNWLSQRLSRITLNQVMLYALIAAIAGFILRSLPFAYWVMIGGIVALVVAFLLSLRAGGGRNTVSGNYQKRWRGEPIDVRNYDTGAPTIGDRIVQWFRRRK